MYCRAIIKKRKASHSDVGAYRLVHIHIQGAEITLVAEDYGETFSS